MDKEQRAALRRLAEEATPAAWISKHDIGHIVTSQYSGDWQDPLYKFNPSTILQLLNYIETLEKDAARYRFFRELTWSESSICAVMHPRNAVRLGHMCPSKELLDAAIDAAMQGEAE